MVGVFYAWNMTVNFFCVLRGKTLIYLSLNRTLLNMWDTVTISLLFLKRGNKPSKESLLTWKWYTVSLNNLEVICPKSVNSYGAQLATLMTLMVCQLAIKHSFFVKIIHQKQLTFTIFHRFLDFSKLVKTSSVRYCFLIPWNQHLKVTKITVTASHILTDKKLQQNYVIIINKPQPNKLLYY